MSGVSSKLTDKTLHQESNLPTKESKGRWEPFTDQELRMIAYGLSQIYGDPCITQMLKEINPIAFPGLTKEKQDARK